MSNEARDFARSFLMAFLPKEGSFDGVSHILEPHEAVLVHQLLQLLMNCEGSGEVEEGRLEKLEREFATLKAHVGLKVLK